jgi:hypothetical protein
MICNSRSRKRRASRSLRRQDELGVSHAHQGLHGSCIGLLLQTVAKRAARATRFAFSGQTLYGAIVVLVRVAVVGEAVAWLRVINRSPSPEMTYCRSMTVSVTLY